MSREFLPTNTSDFYTYFVEDSEIDCKGILSLKMFSEGVFYEIDFDDDGCDNCDACSSRECCQGSCSEIGDLIGHEDWCFKECEDQNG